MKSNIVQFIVVDPRPTVKPLLLKRSLHNGLLILLAFWKQKPLWLIGLFTDIWQRF